MRNSVSSKLFLILIISLGFLSSALCQPKGYVPREGPFTTVIFDSSFVKALYKGSFDISKTHLSGLFLIKRTDTNSIRIVFSNEFGMKFFDFEFNDDAFVVHYCFPSFERRSLMKLLERDFRLLMVPDNTVKSMKRERSKDPESIVFMVKSARGSFHYTYDLNSGRIRRILTSGSVMGKTDLHLSGAEHFYPARITLSNPAIRLHIKITFLSN
jgi:hypothetical protein